MKSFTHYYQQNALDCGPSCLRMIAKFYGKNYSAETLRRKCFTSREGVSMLAISDAAESMGFRTVGVKITWEQLKDQLPLPCILHWNRNHFIVVYDVINRRHKTTVRIADPASGLIDYTDEEFKSFWLHSDINTHGVALLLEPTPAFFRNDDEHDKRRISFIHILNYLKPYKSYIAQIFLAMIIAGIISLVLPLIMQSIVDKGITSSNLSLIVILLTAQLFLAIGGMANNLIKGWLMLHTTTRVSVSLISDFLCKLMKLPIPFFNTRTVGDIMQRIGDYSRIQSFLTVTLLSMLVAVVSLIVYGVIMTEYSIVILLVFLIGSLLYILWVLLFMKRRKTLEQMRFQQAAANQNSIVQIISGIQDIKLNNCEKQMRWDWERIQAKLFRVNIKTLSLGQVQEAGSFLIDQLKNIIISYIAAKSVIEGNMTLGMMMALQFIMGQVNAPISQFITFVQSAQDASISLARLAEIHEAEDEEPEGVNKINEIPKNAIIEFNKVAFQYDDPNSPLVLDGVSLSFPPGKTTAIVGASGSGKTTMLKLVQGFHQPSSGEIRIGGIPLGQYSIRQWREKCGSVMQDSFIFSDSIAANIALSEEHPNISKVRHAAEIANISGWIEGLPMGYQTRIGFDGRGLSAGQKQRLLIARAIYKNADYCFFDEATNSLDAYNENDIMGKINTLFKGKTVIIVAHRLSTVKNADNIIVLNNGKIVEQGTHEQLSKIKGYYFSLVRNQLGQREIIDYENGR